jgi:hypothetical protein
MLGNGVLTPRSLQHKFEVELKDGSKQTRLSTLCEYGSAEPGGYSAMAKLGEHPFSNNVVASVNWPQLAFHARLPSSKFWMEPSLREGFWPR